VRIDLHFIALFARLDMPVLVFLSQSTFWTIQELEKQHKDKINQFRRLANNII